MVLPQYVVVTHGDLPDLHDQLPEAFREVWPESIFHDRLASEYISRVEEYFAFFGILVVDGDRVVAS